MWAAARPKWWGFLCETTTDNCLARTRRTHLGGRAEIHFPLSLELLITMWQETRNLGEALFRCLVGQRQHTRPSVSTEAWERQHTLAAHRQHTCSRQLFHPAS
jgi:hypothetical protein